MDTIQWYRASSVGFPTDGSEVLILIKDTYSPVIRIARFEDRSCAAGNEYWDCDLYWKNTYEKGEVEYWAYLPEIPKLNRTWTVKESCEADFLKKAFSEEVIIYRSEQGTFTILNKTIITLKDDSFPSLEVGKCACADDISRGLYKTSKFSDDDIKGHC